MSKPAEPLKSIQSSTDLTLSLLKRAHSPETATRINAEKINHRPLHLKPTTPNPQLQRRQTRLNSLKNLKNKQKPAPLSARQKRALCLYDIPKANQKYGLYEGLHDLWMGYMHELLFDFVHGKEEGKGGNGNGNGDWGRCMGQGEAAKMCAADFHGAKIEVVRSRCVSRVGVGGIVIRDSRGVFVVVTERDQIKSIPKEGTVFRVAVPRPRVKVSEGVDGDENNNETEVAKDERESNGGRDVVFEIHGNQFQYRAADRANRKFKTHFLPDL